MSSIPNSIEIIRLLDSGAESRNHDFKRGFSWQDRTAETLGLVIDIMAFSNTQDGGTVILGVDDSTQEFASVSGRWWDSFDTTRIVDILNKYCDPRLDIQVFKDEDFAYRAKRGPIVVLQIPEFTDVPVICKIDGNTSDQKCIFNAGEIYIRTNRASTEIISNSQDMRDLTNRAMLKHGDRLLQAFSAIASGQRLPQPVINVFEQYENEIKEAEDEIG
ncbi:MAG: AlbA family DNA-binding domain-containing protein [Nitrosotalea sp.]